MMKLATRIVQVFLLGIFFLPFVQSQGCTDTCTDYHRLCPGTTNAAFFAQYQSDVTSGLLAKFEADETPQPDCNNRLFAYLCPQSCGLCSPCFESKLEAAEARISSLETQLKSLSDSLIAMGDELESVRNGVTVAISEIPINSATSSGIYSNTHTVEKSFDGGLETQVNNCFHSKAYTNAWAEYQIPTSRVFKVGVLNRQSVGSAKRLKGSRVEVCTLRGGCTARCGVFPDVAASSWGFVDCPKGGIEGNYVRITNDASFLQICEMDIKGQILTNPSTKPAQVLASSSSPIYGNQYTVAKSHDGGFDTNIENCFHSQASNDGWAEYQIEPASVKYVGVLNRASVGAAKRLAGARVEVCQQSGGCNTVCGVFADVAASSWGYVECQGAGVQGSYVRVVNPGEFLQICEIDIVVA